MAVMPPTPTRIATVTVTVSPSSVLVGQTAHATATLKDSTGTAIVGRPITWQSSNSTVAAVAPTGDVTALAPGTAMIAASSEGKSASSALSVSAPAPIPVASVSVSPATASLQVGGTAQLSAVTRDANNNVLTSRSISWNSSNGAVATVSASGLVTAVAAGSAQISATSEGQSGSATLTATSPPPPPPPGTSNEPSGMTAISDRPFNARNELGWTDGGGTGEFDFRSDPTAPHSPPSILHAWYPAGYLGGGGPVAYDYPLNNPRTMYIRFWTKLSANFWGHGSEVNKQCYLITSTPSNVIVFSASGQGSGPLRPQIRLQNTVSYPGSAANLDPNLVPGATIPRDQWYMIEIVAVGNTAGKVDGSIDWYLNGVHVGSYPMEYEAGGTVWGRFHGTTLWGGSGDIVPALMWVDWDHVYLSAKN
jgi:hypothetical protein